LHARRGATDRSAVGFAEPPLGTRSLSKSALGVAESPRHVRLAETSLSPEQAATYVVGGSKGWPAVSTWRNPGVQARDVLVFKWKGTTSLGARLLGRLGKKHSVAMAASQEDFKACNTKKVDRMIVKPRRKAKKSFILDFSDYYFFSTTGKDCAQGMKITINT
ncbi:hypothetical protein CLOM_g10978, partial [Closterium sp. NIES-68]